MHNDVEDDYDDEEDDLVRQFEAGHNDDDDDVYDEIQEKYFREFKQKAKHLYEDDDEEEELDPELEQKAELKVVKPVP